jgi:hypothetical protein
MSTLRGSKASIGIHYKRQKQSQVTDITHNTAAQKEKAGNKEK